MTVTAVLSCGHMTQVPEDTVLPEVAECPRSGYEREIASLDEGGTGTSGPVTET